MPAKLTQKNTLITIPAVSEGAEYTSVKYSPSMYISNSAAVVNDGMQMPAPAEALFSPSADKRRRRLPDSESTST